MWIGWKQVHVVRVEQRQLLLTVHGIVRVVDVEHDALGRPCEAAAVEVDLAKADTGERAPVGKVLQSRERRLTHQIGAALWATADRDLQSRIRAQRIDVVAILVAGGNHQHPRPRHIGIAMTDPGRIAVIAEGGADRLGQTQARLDLTQDDETAVRRQAAGIERGCEQLGLDR